MKTFTDPYSHHKLLDHYLLTPMPGQHAISKMSKHQPVGRRQSLIPGVIILLCTGCVSSLPQSGLTLLAPYAVEYYKRTLNEFDQAVFYKPAQNSEDQQEDILFTMAPLIIDQMIQPTENGARQQGFGAVHVDAPSRVTVDPACPTVYTDTAVAQIDGESYDQILYVWWYQPSQALHIGQTILLRGVRITLRKDGFPLVVEVLDDEGVDLMFVSQTLENAAQKAFGPPLPGRSFSVEREVSDAPRTVVARILADGPIPMGPYVYLQADSKAVTTLSCRCMPSQVRYIVETTYYDLIPLEALGSWGLQNVRQHTDYDHRWQLDQRLRWPVP